MNKLIKHYSTVNTALLTALLFLTAPAVTRAAGSVEKIFISADHMQMNILSGKSTYTGKVKISQGELLLMGDKVTLERSKESIQRITVIGKPAHYKHVTEAGDTINAQSEHMVYIASKNKLILTINAHLLQPDLKLSSQKIVYDTKKKIVIAGSGSGETDAETATKQNQRVNITLTPKEPATEQ